MSVNPDRVAATAEKAAGHVALPLALNAVVFGGLLWAFGGLLEEVLDAETLVHWDMAVNGWFHAHASSIGLRFMSAATMLGSWVAIGIAVLVALWLWRRRAHGLLWLWVLSNGLGQAVLYLIKQTVHRQRPMYSGAYLHGHSYSFPSGHTMTAVVVYTLLAFVLAELRGWNGGARAAAYAAAGAVALLVAFSRVYLGVHYPSDVAGGLLAGSAWVIASITIVEVVHRRRRRADASY